MMAATSSAPCQRVGLEKRHAAPTRLPGSRGAPGPHPVHHHSLVPSYPLYSTSAIVRRLRREAACLATPPRSVSGADYMWDGLQPRRVKMPEMPASSRKYASLLPPFWERKTEVYEVFEGLWFFEQPLNLGVGDVSMRMTVMRLQDGTLWVHAPVALTEECRRALAYIDGPVAHVVIPSITPQHWVFASAYAKYYPDAVIWVPPGLVEMSGELSGLQNIGMVELAQLVDARPRVMGDSVPAPWRPDIEGAMFVCPVYVEFTFCLAKYGVLLTSNLCLGTETSRSSSASRSSSGSVDEAEQGGGRGIGGWLAGIAKVPFRAVSMLGRLGSPVAYPIFNNHKPEALAWVMKITDMDFDIVLPSSFDAPIYNGRQQFFECFGYVLAWDKQGSSSKADNIV